MHDTPKTLAPERFKAAPGQALMTAIVTTGRGGFEQLVPMQVPVPQLGPGEVLLQVLASSVNNTDINTRLGWYDAAVTGATDKLAAAPATEQSSHANSGWQGPSPFPFIQGTDCCGRVVALAAGLDRSLIGQRVLVRPCMRPHGFDSWDNVWLGSDLDGAFAQYLKVPASEVFAVHCDWSDAELGIIPCAFGTAENMLHHAGVSAHQHVLVTGASGGVGVATVLLAKRRGAVVTAITSGSKMAQLRAIGADRVLDRADNVLACLGAEAVDVVVDNVAGSAFPELLTLLKRGGCHVTSGAIAGPMVTLDLRVLYLKNLRLLGCTAWAEAVFPNLICYIEHNDFRPLLARNFTLDQIELAQREFLKKEHVGKIALLPSVTESA
ncbi:zinc-binding dehydrogenase, partial [Rhodoferax sp.]|uniref:zinc-binding dehydrogenase n=1 Tax=Rhodoferax sp. TaxID=50421 RepID=UPI0025ECBF0D